jgi:hypothetical protein
LRRYSEERQSQFVFIGKNLDHAELKKGFESCILTPELLANKVKALRFGLGDKVGLYRSLREFFSTAA